MARELPYNLQYFIKNALQDSDDGYEYASELCRVLHSDDCQKSLTSTEIEALAEFAEQVKKVGEINHYTEEKIKDIECVCFGSRGIKGYLNDHTGTPQNLWPF